MAKDQKEQAANARLRAASPDLLAACETALDDYEAAINRGKRLRRETVMDVLRRAIAKARD